MSDPTDTGDHHFTPDDVNTILGRVEPPDPANSAPPGVVDPTTSDAERTAQVQRAMADLHADGADPKLVRHLAALAWHQGWCAGWDQRGTPGGGVSRNPYETERSS